ncbi:subunit 2 of NADH dehydrogenase [Chloropicon primus]|uniref:Subunit 2 of NADH dehydrogenase [ubiquinone] 1 alpha subcomplex n=1 Tax=Chloropicon primus TaxID=1764295 RepID=A0A5B8N036_9CHLO|nr:subunit 2 of NADH dehydrogenase [ubiquinone] 1 alpha subcomplex [Chloropicon primus]UPR04293.1 subunit 2 of NADH dehydrogenase [Chloropicon primus]|eukprot:QDZ25084.1 subunit 2 of NADH dehydrogenase [ubiquinone] 1 alpha subcomplex [Chloropicon primus]
MASAWRGLVTKNLREIRFHLCQNSKGSEGLREFVKKNYKDLKTKNPSFPFLVRECEGAEAKVWARYDKGVEKNVSVEGLTAKSVEEQLQTLVTQKA